MKKITIGITAHVDSGKTTLAEALLYKSGAIRSAGRVDNKDSTLDTNYIERDRGITIFSSQAEFSTSETQITLLDTPGHVDFSSEAERTLCVIDYAILVISGSDGVQSHTLTIWKLLERYDIPVFIFINKMDLITAERDVVLANIQTELSPNCVDFSGDNNEICENTAACCEDLLEKYLSDDSLSDSDIISAISERRIFPCLFGSALKMQGIEELISILDRYTVGSSYSSDFGAFVYKISYDSKGTRLSHIKITGGTLKTRDELEYSDESGNSVTNKISSIRFYTGEKFRTADIAEAGEVCTVTGLTGTYAGQAIGTACNSYKSALEPVMTYRIVLPDEVNIYEAIKKLKLLNEEDPQLRIFWNEHNREIQMQIMGSVQLEVITKIIEERFGFPVSFENGNITYKETIASAVEGVGHYEPLRHYAEVHILLEPLPAGSGLQFDTICPEDKLDRNWQRLILTHLKEKHHIGVLTGSRITDMKLTLVAGKAHLKHTEGGDFRQATYRAVRQGLLSARSVLLEPYYNYEIILPTDCVGRALSDLQRMSADFDTPVNTGETSVIKGIAPASEINNYQSEIITYTQGKGRIFLSLNGYAECHNTDEVVAAFDYHAESDIENSGDSVFCSHGAGYIVKWNEVRDHMHIPLFLQDKSEHDAINRVKRAENYIEKAVSDEELMRIFEMTYGKLKSDPLRAFKKTKISSFDNKKVRLPHYSGPDYLLVDGYNIIFSWDDLKKTAEQNLDAARGELINRMCNYQGYTGYEVILVFDAYKVKGKHRDIEKYCNINIVYTKESETADSYIEKVTHELSKEHRVRVATSDGVEQMIILGNGAMRISASELKQRCDNADAAIKEFIDSLK